MPITLGVMNYAEFKSIEKHPANRACGDPDETVCYGKDAIKAGDSHHKKLIKCFEDKGYRNEITEYIIGEVHGTLYLQDGQHRRAAIKEINEKCIARGEKPMYDEFMVKIFHYGDDEDLFIRDLEIMNNLHRKHSKAEHVRLSNNEKINELLMQFIEMGFSEGHATIAMFGNMTSGNYENLKESDLKNNIECKMQAYKNLLNGLKEKNETPATMISDYITSGRDDVFIVIDELFNYIWHNIKYNLENSERNALSDLLIRHIVETPSDYLSQAIRSCLKEGRKKDLKLVLSQVFTSRGQAKGTETINLNKERHISFIRELNGSILKDMIKTWENDGKNGNNGK